MITLAFLLDHQVISRSDKNTVVAGSKNYVRARFILRTDDWARPITAIFGGYTQLLDDNNECTVPWEVLQQPAEVEVFDLGDRTDMILRRDIQQTQLPLEDGGTQTIWTCEERQHRVPGSYTAEDVQADFDAWWDYDPTVPDEPDDPETRIMALLADAIRGGVNGV